MFPLILGAVVLAVIGVDNVKTDPKPPVVEVRPCPADTCYIKQTDVWRYDMRNRRWEHTTSNADTSCVYH